MTTTQLSRMRTGKRGRRAPTLERQAISFTVGLYLFICLTLLAVHYAAPSMPQVEDAQSGDCGSSSSTSPFNPC
ncbi:hypothetical protein [Jiangella muralis]|uniref:hypothetical protein n=1 Tax=Jiangella muralis TaxID=702383 RepID=UPI00069FB143|nr:hypothetical protein [Jiangella muralis]